MDREALLRFMRTRFAEAGFTPDETEIHTGRFSERYAKMNDEEIEKDLETHGGCEKIVNHVIRYRNNVLMKDEDYQKFVRDTTSSMSRSTVIDPSEESAPAPTDESEEEGWKSVFDTLTENQDQTSVDSQTASAIRETPEGFFSDNGSVPDTDNEQTMLVSTAKAQAGQSERNTSYGSSLPAKSSKFNRLPSKTYWGPATEDGFRRFIILFSVTLPLSLAIVAFFTVLCIGVIAALVLGIIALIVCLICEVAVGAAIALVGIIYGISQLFIVKPAGMFELGIGIASIGVTMFVAILTYNLAIRFLPFVLKQFLRFVRFIPRHFKNVFYYLRGECYRR